MLEEYNFRLGQLRSIKAVLENISNYRPDGKTPADVEAMITSAETVRDTFEGEDADLDLARGQMKQIAQECHGLCVQVYPIMKSRFRADPGSFDAICKLPVDDDTPAETFTRMQSISKLWAKLPNPPGSTTPFKAWDTMGRMEFDAKLTAFKTEIEEFSDAEQDYEKAQGNLHAERRKMQDFIVAALEQGRGQFRPGTPEREQIDAVPIEGSTPVPGQAQITYIDSLEKGSVTLEFNAPHATKYKLLHKAAGASTYVLLADDVTETFYEKTELAAGLHSFIVIGKNSRGEGAESAPASIQVG